MKEPTTNTLGLDDGAALSEADGLGEAARHIDAALTIMEARVSECVRTFMAVSDDLRDLVQSEVSVLARVAEQTESIAAELRRLVIVFQFHDVVRQRLQHALAYLEAGGVPPAEGDTADRPFSHGPWPDPLSSCGSLCNNCDTDETDITLF